MQLNHDVLIEIFQQSLLPEDPRVHPLEADSIQPLLNFSSVCRLWRDAATSKSMRPYWSNFAFDLVQPGRSLSSILRLMRHGHESVALSLFTASSDDPPFSGTDNLCQIICALNLAIEQIDLTDNAIDWTRWQHVFSQVSALSASRLDLGNAFDLSTTHPMLRSLRFSECSMVATPPSHNLVDTLHLDSVAIRDGSQWNTLLLGMPALTTLSLFDVAIGPSEGKPIETAATLVTQLIVLGASASIYKHTRCPQLQVLVAVHSDLVRAQRLLHRSSAPHAATSLIISAVDCLPISIGPAVSFLSDLVILPPRLDSYPVVYGPGHVTDCNLYCLADQTNFLHRPTHFTSVTSLDKKALFAKVAGMLRWTRGINGVLANLAVPKEHYKSSPFDVLPWSIR